MSGLGFRIQHPDGRFEQLTVDSDTVLIGSGAHCEIRLPPEHAAVEHVLIRYYGGAVYAEARHHNPPPLINGSPFTQTPILPQSILVVGQVQMAVAIVEIADNPNVLRKKDQKTNPIVLILAAVIFPICIFLLMEDDGKYGVGDVPEPPTLWSEPTSECPQAARDLASNVARTKKVEAEAKRERCPFYVQDCVTAVPTFEVASACFKAAGEDEAAKEMTTSAVVMRERVNEEYRGHQMRLEHTIMVGDLITAQKQVKVLLAMLDGQQGPYVTWLSNHDRRLALKLGKLKKDKK